MRRLSDMVIDRIFGDSLRELQRWFKSRRHRWKLRAWYRDHRNAMVAQRERVAYYKMMELVMPLSMLAQIPGYIRWHFITRERF